MIGYVVMPILMVRGIPYTLAWPIGLALSVVVACVVHNCVEIPVNALGKRIFRGQLTFETSCSSM
jgi:peptidoglycan/LPS O-acetylase OafA/YrhL